MELDDAQNEQQAEGFEKLQGDRVGEDQEA